MDIASATDEDLTALVLGTQDAEAFGELVRRNQVIVRGLLLRMAADAATADDVAQEAFLHAFERLDQFKGTGTFRAWLCRVAYTKMLMLLRKRKSDAKMQDAFAESWFVRETSTDAQGNTMDLSRALSMLTEAERAAVVLSYASDFSHAEISQALNLPLGTVKSHVNRGRGKLRKLLGAQQVDPDEH